MKPLIENRKYTLAIFFTLLMFLGTHLLGEAAVTPVSERTPQVRDAIVATVPGVNAAADLTEAHLASITTLNMKGENIATLKADDFDGLTALSDLNLYGNQLRRLPDGIFEGLTALRTLRLGGNAVDPLPIPVTLKKVAEGQFKAVSPTGATFDYVLSITATNGSITGGATPVTIPHGRVESEIFTVARTPGTMGEVAVDIETFPRLPREHYGYALVRSETVPLSVIAGVNTAPVFIAGSSVTRSVAENTAAGTNIGAAIAATDAENDTLTYTLSGADASAFAIDTATGQLKTEAALDYETQNAYRVTITVSDGSFTNTITVTITVTDVKENTAPSFYEGNSTTRFVFENTAVGVNIGTPVLATDSTDDLLRYTLGGVHADAFAIDSATGQLKTKVPLDYETQRLYTVTITVDDEVLSDRITVIISVMDVNETLSSAGFLPVIERTPEVRNAIVAAVPNATDAASVTEAAVAAIITLNLRNSGISSLKTGDFSGMTALRNLNLYGNHLSSLPTGIFTGLPALTSLRLGGNVLDPLPLIVSLQSVGAGTFKAVMPTGAPFNIVLPIDVATGGTTHVMIPQGSTESRPFTVVGTGTGTPKVAFHRFPRLPHYHYGYTIAQSTVCNRTEQVAAAIADALGVDDCSTVTELDLAAITSLDLSNAGITALKAGDFDGMLSLTTLSLEGNTLTGLPSGIFSDLISLTHLYLQSNDLRSLSAGVFEGLSALEAIHLQENALTDLPRGIFDGTPSLRSLLLSHNNLISLPTGIFHGLTQLQQLQLRGNPDAASQLPLVVALEKVGTRQFTAVVPSGAPFEIILPIKVANGSLVDGATAILIPKGSLESSPMPLTRTPNTIHAVTVEIETPLPMPPATHNGYGLVNATTGPLEIIEQINVPPVFTEGADTRRTIAENVAIGTDVGLPVTATDANKSTILTYSLDGSDADAFDMDSETGQITTKTALDFETKKTYAVTLSVSDGTLTDTIAVTINVSDVNEVPVFAADSLTTHTVAENTPAGENIGTPYTATDVDADALTYSLDDGADADAFDLNSETGQLKTKADLDFETKKTYSLTLIVSDGTLTDTIAVTINVSDVNEVPVFATDSLTTHAVAENTPSGENIGTPYSATDADGDTLTYSLDEGTDADAFDLDSEMGQLQTKAALDFETKKTYSFTLSVSDGELTDTIAVTINVSDVNEAPVFAADSLTTHAVAENTPAGENIGTPYSATDVDRDTLTYSLDGADADAFDIDSETGQIKTKAALDYETKTSYSVRISVSDGKRTDTLTLTIDVTDVEENRAPAFTDGSTTTRSIAENTRAGVNIGSAVGATDPDDDDLTYSLSGTDAAAFSIVSTSGQLQTNAHLDYERKSSYSVTVSVSDGKGKSDSIDVTITVTDVYERPPNRAPIFTEGSSTTRSVADNTVSGKNIGDPVSATDVNSYNTLTYSLSGPDAASFSIDSTSGQLQTRIDLDYERKSSYSVTVSVSDGRGGSDSIDVTITVINYAPYFTGVSSDYSIEGSTTYTILGSKQRTIGTFSATDVEGDPLTYSLSGTDATSFSINSQTGQLQTITGGLNYTTKKSYSVTIIVSDDKGRRNSMTVTVNVLKPVTDRTQQVRDEIVAESPVSDPANVTEAHLRAITELSPSLGGAPLNLGDFDGLTGLTDLGLHQNALTSLPAGIFGRLTALTRLKLWGNALTSLPAGIFDRLTALTRLDLSDNALTALPPNIFDKLTQLTLLELSDNALTSLPSNVFNRLTKLTLLELSDNALTALPPNIFDKLTKLEDLYLNENALTALPAGIFDRLTALTGLRLWDNALTALPPNIFDKLTNLTSLRLFDNNITDMSALEGVTSLTHLFVRGNPISDYGPLQRLKIANPGVTIDVTFSNNPPVFTEGDSATRSVAENTTSGQNIGAAVAATDADTGHTLTYTLGGTDAASFSIVSGSGQLQTSAALDYETKTSYTVTVTVNDGNSGGDRITVTINVTDVAGAAPSIEMPPVIPDETDLLTNFPNPFNPETWIPYQLATPADVTLTIYDVRGVVVRELKLGHQAAGFYQSRSRAIHWDGRNMLGEKVATGLYFYTLKAGDYAATRKLLIRK